MPPSTRADFIHDSGYSMSPASTPLWHYRWNLVERSLFRPRAWRRFDLPDALFPLYALLSPSIRYPFT